MKKLEQILTKDQFNRFIYNLYFHNRLMCENINHIKTYINLEPSVILLTTFNWSRSKERHKYWLIIYNKLYVNERTSKITE